MIIPVYNVRPYLRECLDSVINQTYKKLQLYGQADHLRIFGADSEKLLENAGFVVSRIEGDKMPDAILPINGPADYDVNYLFVCRKPE